MDVVKQRLQLGCYDNAWHCIRSIANSPEGVGAFYRSLPSTLIMECPFYAILVACNDSLKIWMGLEDTPVYCDRSGAGATSSSRSSSAGTFFSLDSDRATATGSGGSSRGEEVNPKVSVGWHFASAGVAGVVASACTQPLDVVKTRLQTQEILRVGFENNAVVYRGLLPTFLRRNN